MANELLLQTIMRRVEALARMEMQCVAELNEVRHVLGQIQVRVQMTQMLLGSIAREVEFIRNVAHQLQDAPVDKEGD